MLPTPWSQRLQQLALSRKEAGRHRRILEPRGLDFCSNDYLGLRRDPRLAEAASEAAHQYGTGTGAARLLRGSTPLHEALEEALAQWKGKGSALLFNTGYQANATIIPALVGTDDAVFSDALNHASLVDGCRVAKAGGASVHVYRHLDLHHLEHQLKAWRAKASAHALALVVTDGVFSMDGDAADLPSMCALCERHGALLLVDEAHATGLLGATGAGLCEAQGVTARVPLIMGTLGKALGVAGAFVCADALVREHLVNTARGFIFSTALPPPVVGAALEAVRLAQGMRHRAGRALEHAARVRSALSLPPLPSAIVPWVVGSEGAAMDKAGELQRRGFDVRAVRPPTVPEGLCRLRITTGAHLHEPDLEAFLHALSEVQ
jgi:8-amino-7-oxononanoate synthase